MFVFGEMPNLRFVISEGLCAQKSGTLKTNSREKHFLTYGFVSKTTVLLTIDILTFWYLSCKNRWQITLFTNLHPYQKKLKSCGLMTKPMRNILLNWLYSSRFSP
ncbi:NADH:ubiquinone oxidoreductase subunit B-like Fe-S oxidoreductase [Parabacteroides sp. PFB2-10]|nr:NADH:ubiquinone oxidoreductase subunit B-like Fe-S oxidoreductase [Parabacteroides sp. PFB2-10]